MDDICFGSQSSSVPNRLLLHGLGGSGKTQLCLKYLQDHGNKFSHAWWVDASSQASLENGISHIIQQSNNNQRATLMEILGKLDGPWLLIYDDVSTEIKDFSQYLPRAGNGSVIMTARTDSPNRGAQTVLIKGIDKQAAIQLLLEVARQWPCSEDVRDAASLLVERLGYLALAINMAGKYISEKRLTIKQFLELYERRPSVFLKVPDDSTVYSRTIHAALDISYGEILRASELGGAPYAAEILHFCAFLHSGRSSDLIIRKAWANRNVKKAVYIQQYQLRVVLANCHDPETLLVHDINSTLSLLTSYAFLSDPNELRGSAFEGSTMHPIVQEWLSLKVDATNNQSAWGIAAATLALSVDTDHESRECRAYMQSILPHIERLEKLSSSGLFGAICAMGCSQVAKVDLAQLFADIFSMTGHPRQARDLRIKLYDYCARHLKDDKWLLVVILRHLGHSHRDLGDYWEALKTRKEALKLLLFFLQGEKSPELIKCKRDLAEAYRDFGQYDNEVQLRQEAYLDLMNLYQNKQHDEVLEALIELKDCRIRMGGIGNMLEDLKELVTMLRANVSEGDHRLLRLRAELARSYSQNLLFQESLEEREQILIIRQKHHSSWSDILIANQDVATSKLEMGQPEIALGIMDMVVKEWEKRQNPLFPEFKDPKLLSAKFNLAQILAKLKNYKDRQDILLSQKLHLEIYTYRSQALSLDSPEILESMEALAFNYSRLNGEADKQETVRYRNEIIQILQAKPRSVANDRQVWRAMNDLATTYLDIGWTALAMEERRKVIEEQMSILGQNDLDTLITMSDHVQDLAQNEEYEAAEAYCRRTLDLQVRFLGTSHPQTWHTMMQLAKRMKRCDHTRTGLQRGLKVVEELLDIQRAQLGPKNPQTKVTADEALRVYRDIGGPESQLYIDKLRKDHGI